MLRRRELYMTYVKNIIVGCGLSGASLARLLAHRLGEQVLVVEQRNHIGGNCYDYFDANSICIHQYGAHIFHTNDDEAWDFLAPHTSWHPYQHRVRVHVGKTALPLPFNLDSLRKILPHEEAETAEQALI